MYHQTHVERSIRFHPVLEIILEVVVDPKAGAHRPTSGAGWIPGQAYARLPERDGVVLDEHRLANEGLGEDEPSPVIGVISAATVDFIPSRGHLVAQA